MEKMLDAQLAKLQTDHVDFYLMHALDRERFAHIKKLDYKRFLNDMRAKGKIRFAGFSFHDDFATFKEILADYDWKFAQVQMNLLDEFNQATLEGIKYAETQGVGIAIMEPLRGGMLAKNPPRNVADEYAKLPEKRTHIDWCFRWLYDQSGIKVILSGMSTMAQLDDNLRIFSNTSAGCLSEAERGQLANVRRAYESRTRVGCTGCDYCAECPKEIHISKIFRNLDSCYMFDDMDSYRNIYAGIVNSNHDASRCVKCGKCEAVCPQKFPIRRLLAEIDAEFHPQA